MKEKVRIHLCGRQTQENGEKDETTQSFIGRYHKEGSLHCVTYEEELEDGAYILHTLRFGEKELCINRKGAISANLRLEEGSLHETDYVTPYGRLKLGVETGRVEVKEAQNRVSVLAEYDMYLEGRLHASCRIYVEVERRPIWKIEM